MTLKEILAVLVSQPTVGVPFTGKVLAELNKNSSYDAANKARLGVDVIEVGGKKRCTSISILRKLGYDNELIALLMKHGVIELSKEEAA
jgi:hypothetical protein